MPETRESRPVASGPAESISAATKCADAILPLATDREIYRHLRAIEDLLRPRCRKCSRPISSPASIECGIGSSCRRAVTPVIADVIDLSEHVENFRRRLLQDAVLEAESAYWRRRAEQTEAARPRPDDYPGKATPADLAARDARLEAVARACRARAAVALIDAGHIDQVLEDTLAGVTG